MHYCKGLFIRFFYLIFLVLLSMFIYSCNSLDEIDDEQKLIDDYVLNLKKDTSLINNKALFFQNNGIQYVRIKAGDTTKVFKDGETIEFRYQAIMLSSMITFDTNIREVALKNKMDTSFLNFDVKKITIGQNNLVEGLQRGLSMLHRGEEAIIIFKSDIGFGKQNHGIVPAYSTLMFIVDIAD